MFPRVEFPFPDYIVHFDRVFVSYIWNNNAGLVEKKKKKNEQS